MVGFDKVQKQRRKSGKSDSDFSISFSEAPYYMSHWKRSSKLLPNSYLKRRSQIKQHEQVDLCFESDTRVRFR